MREKFTSALFLCAGVRYDTAMPNTESVFKIFQHKEWMEFIENSVFTGSEVDLTDGYVHLSTETHMQDTLDKHYTSGADVVIAEIDMERIEKTVKWEISRGGAKFPHQYGVLSMDDIMSHSILSPDAQGRYGFRASRVND